ncbi:MAG: hypothetical protein OSB82_02045 [Alphaproteobacteria bacterium]|nr:hypothetical protein [Alphaproteobacteria bacterium]
MANVLWTPLAAGAFVAGLLISAPLTMTTAVAAAATADVGTSLTAGRISQPLLLAQTSKKDDELLDKDDDDDDDDLLKSDDDDDDDDDEKDMKGEAALTVQFQQAVGQHVQLQLDAFVSYLESRDNGSGARAEILVQF